MAGPALPSVSVLMMPRLTYMMVATIAVVVLSACGEEPSRAVVAGDGADGRDGNAGDLDLAGDPIDLGADPDGAAFDFDPSPDLPVDQAADLELVPVDVAEVADPADEGAEGEFGADPGVDPGAEGEPDEGPSLDVSPEIEGVALDFVPLDVPQDELVFPMGVQSGAPRSDSMLVWTYFTDGFAKRLVVWSDRGLVAFDGEILPGPAGYTHVSVDGLSNLQWYSYAFFVPDLTGRSAIGRFRTPPAPGSLEPVKIGATSCTNRSTMPWEALELTADLDIDLAVQLGDMSYNDGAVSLSDYRAEWRETLTDPGYLAFLQAAALIVTWDDHEVDDNWDPESMPRAQQEAARQAWYETLAVEGGVEDPIWRSYSWGDTVEFFVLDCRSERRPSTRTGASAQYISPEQLDWLQRGLVDSTAHFKVVLSSVPITNMPTLWDLAQGDRWEGYRAQRETLLDFIVENEVSNVWFLGGDFHIGFVGKVEPSGPASSIWEIAVGPGGNGPNPLSLTLNGDQFPFHTPDFGLEFVTTLEFDPERDAVRVTFLDVGGEILFDRWLQQTP